MADKHFSYFLIVFIIKQTKTVNLQYNMPDIAEKDFNMQSHLKFESVWEYCSHRDDVCRSNNTRVCAVKMVEQKKFYKDFINGCYLFLSNMCDHPQDEYFIVTGGSCEKYLSVRRSNNESEGYTLPDYEMTNSPNSTETNFGDNGNNTDNDNEALRQRFSTLYEIDTSFDYHICPHSCPNTYSPQCVNVNRGFGKYFKLLIFVNHCSADLYYCKHWREFKAPPNEDESVRASPLGWSFCGASRYLQFARFAEAASSIGHYGWLAGDYRYSRILKPQERMPGYG